MRYCKNCNKNVKPMRKLGIWDLIFAFMTVGLYLVWYYTAKPKRCPSCNGTQFSKAT